MHSATTSHLSKTGLTRVALAALLVASACALAACGKKDAAQAAGGPGGNRPPPQVGVIVTKIEPVALETELPARVEPCASPRCAPASTAWC